MMSFHTWWLETNFHLKVSTDSGWSVELEMFLRIMGNLFVSKVYGDDPVGIFPSDDSDVGFLLEQNLRHPGGLPGWRPHSPRFLPLFPGTSCI